MSAAPKSSAPQVTPPRRIGRPTVVKEAYAALALHYGISEQIIYKFVLNLRVQVRKTRHALSATASKPLAMVEAEGPLAIIANHYTIDVSHLAEGCTELRRAKSRHARQKAKGGRKYNTGCRFAVVVHNRRRRGRSLGRGVVMCLAQKTWKRCDKMLAERGSGCEHHDRKVSKQRETTNGEIQ